MRRKVVWKLLVKSEIENIWHAIIRFPRWKDDLYRKLVVLAMSRLCDDDDLARKMTL